MPHALRARRGRDGDFSKIFKTFYTNSEMEVKYTTVNKFEGRSNYFSYFPTDDLKELQLEQVWWRH